jgi:hypothetical protein
MDFACMRCAHRQAEDTSCGGCGNDVVQDLRDSRARQYLHEEESRWQRKRHARFISLGALVAVPLIFLMYYVIFPLILAQREAAGLGARAGDRVLGWIPILVGFGGGLGVIAVLEMTLGRKRKFPYLDEYGS